jgi:hypothetical protein
MFMMTEKEKKFIISFFKKVLMVEFDFDENELKKISYEEDLKNIAAQKLKNDSEQEKILQKHAAFKKTIKQAAERFLKKYPSIDAEKKSIELSELFSSLVSFNRVNNHMDDNNPLVEKLFQEELPNFIFHWSKLQFIEKLEESIRDSIFQSAVLDNYSFDYREKLSSFLAEQLAEMIKDKESDEIEFIITQLLKIISTRKNNIIRFDEKAKQEIQAILKKNVSEIIKLLEKSKDDWIDELLVLPLNEKAITQFIRELYTKSDEVAEKYKLTSIDAFESIYFKSLEKNIYLASPHLYDLVYRLAYMESVLKDDRAEKTYCTALYGKTINQYAVSMKMKEKEAISNIENDVRKNKQLQKQEQAQLNASIQEMKNYGRRFEADVITEKNESEIKKNKKMGQENIPLAETFSPQHNSKAAIVMTLASQLTLKSQGYYVNHHYQKDEKEIFCNELIQEVNNTANLQKKSDKKSLEVLSVLQEWMERIKGFFAVTVFNFSQNENKKSGPVEKVKKAIEKLTV